MKLFTASSEISEKQFYFMRLKRRGINPAHRRQAKTATGGLNLRLNLFVN
jgi:hypothetical protein